MRAGRGLGARAQALRTDRTPQLSLVRGAWDGRLCDTTRERPDASWTRDGDRTKRVQGLHAEQRRTLTLPKPEENRLASVQKRLSRANSGQLLEIFAAAREETRPTSDASVLLSCLRHTQTHYLL
uniref:Uncharacterized protein n=1 Tax=Kalanchoe fedtschenkoi TaxID=63787 RepID=A0A7N0UF94_KALFE